ncbi:sodium channel regulatory subunit beta-4 isoform X2 [Ascaphus truei]
MPLPPWDGGLSPRRRNLYRHCQAWVIVAMLALFLAPACFPLEVSVGKIPQITARNGTDIMLPCVFSTCMGFEDVTFSWAFNNTDQHQVLYKGTLKNKQSEPRSVGTYSDRVELIPSSAAKDYNLSLLLKDVDFSDAGRYTCYVTNKKEKNAKHNATLYLTVVEKFKVVDNTITKIIGAAVGGAIGLLILILIMKKVICLIIKRKRDKKKECLVSSSVNDNTDNASKPESKAKSKA